MEKKIDLDFYIKICYHILTMNGNSKQGDLTMDKWLTLEQIAEYLQMSTSSIYKMAQKGKIPAYKVDRQWRFKREEIDAWVERQKPKKR
jgi:excisionase family DNA binding protein